MCGDGSGDLKIPCAVPTETIRGAVMRVGMPFCDTVPGERSYGVMKQELIGGLVLGLIGMGLLFVSPVSLWTL